MANFRNALLISFSVAPLFTPGEENLVSTFVFSFDLIIRSIRPKLNRDQIVSDRYWLYVLSNRDQL